MALCVRLLGRQYLGCHGLRPVFVSQCRNVSIQPRPADVPIEEEHDERNMRLGRPQSPHMTIFKWQLPAVLSITHRITGIILSGYATTFAAVSLLSNKPMGEIINNISQCYPNFFLCFKIGLLFPFSYHFYNGMRHLVWDGGKSLSLKGVYTSGYVMLLAAGVSGIALLFIYAITSFTVFVYFILSQCDVRAKVPIYDFYRVWDTGKCLSLKGVYVTGYLMVFVAIASFGGLFYYLEEIRKQALLEEIRRKEEEAAKALALEEESKKKKGKKKK